MPRGGKREGAGRPKKEETRKQCSLRALPSEWQLILKFARLIKKGNRAACESFLSQFD